MIVVCLLFLSDKPCQKYFLHWCEYAKYITIKYGDARMANAVCATICMYRNCIIYRPIPAVRSHFAGERHCASPIYRLLRFDYSTDVTVRRRVIRRIFPSLTATAIVRGCSTCSRDQPPQSNPERTALMVEGARFWHKAEFKSMFPWRLDLPMVRFLPRCLNTNTLCIFLTFTDILVGG